MSDGATPYLTPEASARVNIDKTGIAGNPMIRELPGGQNAAQEFFDKYSQGGINTTPLGFGGAGGGEQVTLPDGTVINIGYWRIHFGQ